MAEHMRPHGLAYGYYCKVCGLACSMIGHKTCKHNPELVAQLDELNKTKPSQDFKPDLSRRRTPPNRTKGGPIVVPAILPTVSFWDLSFRELEK